VEDGVEMVEVEYVGLSEDDSFEVIGEAGRKRIRAREKEEESRKGEGGLRLWRRRTRRRL
jgi:hypothetical protein